MAVGNVDSVKKRRTDDEIIGLVDRVNINDVQQFWQMTFKKMPEIIEKNPILKSIFSK